MALSNTLLAAASASYGGEEGREMFDITQFYSVQHKSLNVP